MKSKLAITLVVLAILAGLGFGYFLWGRNATTPTTEPTTGPTSTPTATAAPSDDADQALVQRNRNERRGPSWSPADPTGADGELLTLGKIVPGGFEPVMAGMSIDEAMDTEFIEPDPQRAESCEGTFYKWTGQLSDGMDIIVNDADKTVALLGMSKGGTETAEGISIGNSYGALKATYGDDLSEPDQMDYGQAGVFLQDGDGWIGFAFAESPTELTDDSRVNFIEVARGDRPGLLRDGC